MSTTTTRRRTSTQALWLSRLVALGIQYDGGMDESWEISSWAAWMTAIGRPTSTIKLRAYHLGKLAEAHPEPNDIDVDQLAQWLAAQAWAPNTRRSYRTSFRAYWSWRMATGRATSSPAHLLPPITVPRAQPRPAPEEVYRNALASASNDPRALLAIQLAAQCGLRRAEIAQLKREDLEHDLVGWSIRVTGKGGHERMVPVTDELARTIRERPTGWLFPSSHGGHLTPHHLGKVVSAHLEGHYTTHTLRHRCGTIAYQGSRDLRAVQELLGHAKPETTAIYTAVGDQAIRSAMLAAAA